MTPKKRRKAKPSTKAFTGHSRGANPTALEQAFWTTVQIMNRSGPVDERIPAPVPEFKFHLVRKWRFDFAWPESRVAVECEGGTWSDGRHTRGSGFADDCRKYNAAAASGWIILRFTTDMLMKEPAQCFEDLRAALAFRKGFTNDNANNS